MKLKEIVDAWECNKLSRDIEFLSALKKRLIRPSKKRLKPGEPQHVKLNLASWLMIMFCIMTFLLEFKIELRKCFSTFLVPGEWYIFNKVKL